METLEQEIQEARDAVIGAAMGNAALNTDWLTSSFDPRKVPKWSRYYYLARRIQVENKQKAIEAQANVPKLPHMEAFSVQDRPVGRAGALYTSPDQMPSWTANMEKSRMKRPFVMKVGELGCDNVFLVRRIMIPLG